MNANLSPNLQHFKTQVIDYWAWFIDEHEESQPGKSDPFEDGSYTNFVMNSDKNELQ